MHDLTIAVDFDGTLCSHAFPEIGEHNRIHRRIAKFLTFEKEKGAKLILYTCREDLPERKYLSEAVEWCKKVYGLEFDYINENPQNPFGNGRKVMADLYIDDRSLNLESFGGSPPDICRNYVISLPK